MKRFKKMIIAVILIFVTHIGRKQALTNQGNIPGKSLLIATSVLSSNIGQEKELIHPLLSPNYLWSSRFLLRMR